MWCRYWVAKDGVTHIYDFFTLAYTRAESKKLFSDMFSHKSESERAKLIKDCLWEKVLLTIQPATK